uniref:Agmatine deiminase n=1 Tax=Arundo donax TaxID=35708 RepID=A0A0A9DR28_ARUDO
MAELLNTRTSTVGRVLIHRLYFTVHPRRAHGLLLRDAVYVPASQHNLPCAFNHHHLTIRKCLLENLARFAVPLVAESRRYDPAIRNVEVHV